MSNIIFPTSTSNQVLKQENCYGIDLGTTSTLICYVDAMSVDLSKSVKIPIQFLSVKQESPFEYDQTIDDVKVASIVAIYEGKPYVGNNLYHLKGNTEFIYKKNIFYHWKLELGIDLDTMYPDAITPKLNMPFKIAGGILNYIRLQHFKNEILNNTIITVPASFQANQRIDVIKAAEMAKIKTSDNMLIDEPNAAFLGYFNRLENIEKQDWANNVRNKNILVIDFGGGTLDLSILNVDFRKDTGIAISNRAISRYSDLGGQDIDMLIAEEFLLPIFKQKYPNFDSILNTDLSEIILPQLSVIAENLKIGICNRISLKVGEQKLDEIDLNGINFTQKECVVNYKNQSVDLASITITVEEYKNFFSKLFNGKNFSFKYCDKTVSTISQSITDIIEKADLTLQDIQYVLFAGGSSFNPLLHSLCAKKLNDAIPLLSHEPDKLVAEGAAVYSYFLNIHNISLIKPITSETIGVRLKDNRFYPIIEKGKPLPQEVSLPDFRLQSNLNSKVMVPVCINGVDFPIGTIRCDLDAFYDVDTVVKINASISADKIFTLKVFANDNLIGDAIFENPFGLGQMSEEEIEIHKLKKEINKAKAENNNKEERKSLRLLIWKHYENGNYIGTIETAELFLKRFNDQDDNVLNILFCALDNLGRKKAAAEAIKKAIEINPAQSIYHYNYSILLEYSNTDEALTYLENLNDNLKSGNNIKCKIILLKNKLNQNVTIDANKIVQEYKKSPSSFSNFEKSNLIKPIFKIANEPFSFIEPDKNQKVQINNRDLLDTNNLPF
jgi:molecular chaperone DnaK